MRIVNAALVAFVGGCWGVAVLPSGWQVAAGVLAYTAGAVLLSALIHEGGAASES